MRVATWNIYWLGDRTGDFITRSQQDYQLISRVITNLSPDVLALEEIVDPVATENVLSLANANGPNYIIRNTEHWFTSDKNPLDDSTNLQKAFLCINNETIEFVHGAAIRGGQGARRPYAATLRHRQSGVEFVAVVVHLRSGFPMFLDHEDAAKRRQEVEALTRWLRNEATAENPQFPKPDSNNVIVFGDFNAEIDDPNNSLASLKNGSLSDWLWENPLPDGSHWETALYEGDRYVIDFILLSPSLRQKVESPPKVYAWDYDSQMGSPTQFHEGPNGSGNLRGYGVSDHRPVVTDLDLT